MSSFTRKLQRNAKRRRQYLGRGSRLGATSPKQNRPRVLHALRRSKNSLKWLQKRAAASVMTPTAR